MDEKLGASVPNRINRLLKAEVEKSYGHLSNMVMVTNLGLNSEETTDLRADAHKEGIRYRIVRNRIALKTFMDLGVSDTEKLFEGPTAIIDAEDPVMAAKIAVKLCEKFKDKLKINGALVEGKALNSKEVQALAKSKNRAELLADISGQIIGPARQLASAICGPGGILAGCVKAIIEKAESGKDGQAA